MTPKWCDECQAPDELCSCPGLDLCALCNVQLGEHAYEVDVTSPLGTQWFDPVCWECARSLETGAQIASEYTTIRQVLLAEGASSSSSVPDLVASRGPVDGDAPSAPQPVPINPAPIDPEPYELAGPGEELCDRCGHLIHDDPHVLRLSRRGIARAAIFLCDRCVTQFGGWLGLEGFRG